MGTTIPISSTWSARLLTTEAGPVLGLVRAGELVAVIVEPDEVASYLEALTRSGWAAEAEAHQRRGAGSSRRLRTAPVLG